MLAAALTLGFVLIALLSIFHARDSTVRVDEPDEARGFVARQIDAHIEALAQHYLEARLNQGTCRPGTDRFGQAVELFIGDVLLRCAERSEPGLRDALREICVLRRDDVYSQVRKRVEAHLRRVGCRRIERC